MTVIGFHASHEQINPRQLLLDVQRAEQAGFDAAMCSDHIEPWSHAQGHSGFAWSWLGSALATTDLRFGLVTSAGHRYHPAVIAQALGTLGVMFPNRVWAALGSGEHVNERITGKPWPDKEVRQQMLAECFDMVDQMLKGAVVSREGLVPADKARVWDRPAQRPPLYLPALTPETAARFAVNYDGLITINQPIDETRKVLEAYRDSGGKGPAMLQVHLSWAPDEDEAAALAREQWGTNVFEPPVMGGLGSPEDFEARAASLGDELGSAVADAVLISADTASHAQRLHDYIELGFDEVYLHHVGQDQVAFIDTFAEKVLPQLRGSDGGSA
ncbi:TIGR03885 family FMN-dependent LLM class oxidoreductase [Mycobacterium sp. SMC-4]|uniref:TIGR03885 family FMN-dependent LLM class oxidoreductase n=1 Tax=Mycobacterium sp. SMC-4 TaxID=2857059 RepID=UPI0021B27F2A|nr:TIGR03885 family FMN-dependent LLM class oxidoreductase [Mycobacterium sp. SMC-4]UXA17002.1 TIGR03885 family FMN-dependent LLM class oxidoreductase [Mycobacterium sp. SMC-4]